MEKMVVTTNGIWIWTVRILTIIVVLTTLSMWGCPRYKVYSSKLDGEAALAQATSVREIQVKQALGEKEAAVHRAEAIKIVGQATKDYPEYRQQEFIGAFAEAVKEGKISQIIYVPTEGNIPITEAHRMNTVK